MPTVRRGLSFLFGRTSTGGSSRPPSYASLPDDPLPPPPYLIPAPPTAIELAASQRPAIPGKPTLYPPTSPAKAVYTQVTYAIVTQKKLIALAFALLAAFVALATQIHILCRWHPSRLLGGGGGGGHAAAVAAARQTCIGALPWISRWLDANAHRMSTGAQNAALLTVLVAPFATYAALDLATGKVSPGGRRTVDMDDVEDDEPTTTRHSRMQVMLRRWKTDARAHLGNTWRAVAVTLQLLVLVSSHGYYTVLVVKNTPAMVAAVVGTAHPWVTVASGTIGVLAAVGAIWAARAVAHWHAYAVTIDGDAVCVHGALWRTTVRGAVASRLVTGRAIDAPTLPPSLRVPVYGSGIRTVVLVDAAGNDMVWLAMDAPGLPGALDDWIEWARHISSVGSGCDTTAAGDGVAAGTLATPLEQQPSASDDRHQHYQLEASNSVTVASGTMWLWWRVQLLSRIDSVATTGSSAQDCYNSHNPVSGSLEATSSDVALGLSDEMLAALQL
ncbi:hypothetical protein BC828DRAFT_382790 [Blastocladiella britannica]|nr:hypothetical protein BC828DRAFT_382790 [Blastocladiella britannica]